MGLDIRVPLGLIFLIIGGIMAAFGVFSHGDAALYEKSLGVEPEPGMGSVDVGVRSDHVLRWQAAEVAG